MQIIMLECKNLILGYDTPISSQIQLTIDHNQWIGIVGQNGAGKSTFLKTILGVMAPYSGTLAVLGHPPGKVNRYISYIPQEREINLSERMNGVALIESSYGGWRYGLPFINRHVETRAMGLIELVGAEKYARQPFCTLSGGQKKRIYLAQALINKPKILLLDEPLADLDPSAKQHFIQALQKIHQTQQVGLLIISNDMHEISMHLDGFVHFREDGVHYCDTISCAREDTYVGV